MTITLGPDWKDFFDFVIINMHKPLFWNAKNPFHAFDPTNEEMKGQKIDNFMEFHSHLQQSKIMLGGNGSFLTQYLQTTLCKKKLKICYVGTHYLFDVRSLTEFDWRLKDVENSEAKWESIVCMEEIASFDQEKCDTSNMVESDPNYWGPSYFWGADYIIEDESVFTYEMYAKTEEGKKRIKTREEEEAYKKLKENKENWDNLTEQSVKAVQ